MRFHTRPQQKTYQQHQILFHSFNETAIANRKDDKFSFDTKDYCQQCKAVRERWRRKRIMISSDILIYCIR